MPRTTFIASTTASAGEVNNNFDYSEGDVVPHSQGTLADNQFKLGTSSARWGALNVLSINASNIVATGSLNSFGHANPSQVVDILGQTHITNNSSSLPAVALQRGNKNAAQSTSVQIAFGPHASGDTGRLIFENAASTAATNFRFTLHNGVNANDRFQITNDAILRLGRDLILSTASFMFDSANNRAGFAHANPSQVVDILGQTHITNNSSSLPAVALQLANKNTAQSTSVQIAFGPHAS